MEWFCYAINFPPFILSFYPIIFKVTCDHDNRWLIWLVLKDTERKKMRAKYAFIKPRFSVDPVETKTKI